MYLPLAIYGFCINDIPVLKSCFYYVRGFLFIGEQFNSWILWYLLFMVVGMLVARLKIPHVISVILLFVTIFLDWCGVPHFVNCVLFSTSLFLICKEVNSSKEISLCLYLRKISVSTYFIHLWVWTMFYLVVYGEKTFGVIPFLATISITILLSVLYLLRLYSFRCLQK